MFQNDILKKIQNNNIDDEVVEFINENLLWYKKHKTELLYGDEHELSELKKRYK